MRAIAHSGDVDLDGFISDCRACLGEPEHMGIVGPPVDDRDGDGDRGGCVEGLLDEAGVAECGRAEAEPCGGVAHRLGLDDEPDSGCRRSAG
jgi:hypothetical protein